MKIKHLGKIYEVFDKIKKEKDCLKEELKN